MTPRRLHSTRIHESHGVVDLTPHQLYVLKMIAAGEPPSDKRLRASTAWNVKNKILKATGWASKRTTAVFCRFAFKHRLLPL